MHSAHFVGTCFYFASCDLSSIQMEKHTHAACGSRKTEVLYPRFATSMSAVGWCVRRLKTKNQVGSSAWDQNEQRVLEDGLRYYPHEKHSNMFIYIRIAAGLPKKTVRDVAHHLRHMQV